MTRDRPPVSPLADSVALVAALSLRAHATGYGRSSHPNVAPASAVTVRLLRAGRIAEALGDLFGVPVCDVVLLPRNEQLTIEKVGGDEEPYENVVFTSYPRCVPCRLGRNAIIFSVTKTICRWIDSGLAKRDELGRLQPSAAVRRLLALHSPLVMPIDLLLREENRDRADDGECFYRAPPPTRQQAIDEIRRELGVPRSEARATRRSMAAGGVITRKEKTGHAAEQDGEDVAEAREEWFNLKTAVDRNVE